MLTLTVHLIVFSQVRLCRSNLSQEFSSRILKWEHKVIKSFSKHFSLRGGLAIGIGLPMRSAASELVYFRTIDCGSLFNFGKLFLSKDKFDYQVVHDAVLTKSDIERLTINVPIQRSKLEETLKESFLSFVDSIPATCAAFLCTASKTGNVMILSRGLDAYESELKVSCDELIRCPVSPSYQSDINMLSSDTPISLSHQINIINSLPAQCITSYSSDCRSAMPLYVSWPHNAPKGTILKPHCNPKMLHDSFQRTISSTLHARAATSTGSTKKRKRSCATHHLFLRRLAAATNKYTHSTIRRGLSEHRFTPELSPVEKFQTSLCSRGHARVVTFTDCYFEVVWNKFDSIRGQLKFRDFIVFQ
jgi:hypothetical protein